MRRTIFITLLLLIVAALLWQQLRQPAPDERVADEASRRQTTEGPVIGSADSDGTWAWLGIPFAQPPVGDLRWRTPLPPARRDAPLEALAFRSPCLQLWNPVAGVPGGEPGQVVGSEDCLYLNIWAPRQAPEPLPVMVWIHGGGNTTGTANTYPASRLAGSENLVVVTVNYRLGMLGWLSHDALRSGDPVQDSGNFGTLDNIAALQWVQDNIASFGGDPDRVTIFGESAGGRNVFTMLASPLAAGLFQGAIAQSGSLRTTPRWLAENFSDDTPAGHALSSGEWIASRLEHRGLADSREEARALLRRMGRDEIRQFLHGLPADDLLAGLDNRGAMYPATQHFRDGVVLPADSLYTVFSDPARYNSVPLVTGTNRDEWKLFQALDSRYLERRFGFLPRIRDPDLYERTARYVSDGWRAGAVDAAAEIISAGGGAPVFAYRWDWDEGANGWLVDYASILGAAHGLEIGFIFDDYENGIAVPGLYNDENTPGRDWLAQRMRSYWAQFARSGDPGRGGSGDLPRWQSWQPGETRLMVFDTEAGGGLRLSEQALTMAMLKQRLAADPAPPAAERCHLFARLFLRTNYGDDFWDEAEYRALGCAALDPWELAARN